MRRVTQEAIELYGPLGRNLATAFNAARLGVKMASAERKYPPDENLATEWLLYAEAISLEREAATALTPRGNMDPGMQDRYTQLRMDFFAGLAGLVERLQQGVDQKPEPGPLQ
jgi:hypothetical protein